MFFLTKNKNLIIFLVVFLLGTWLEGRIYLYAQPGVTTSQNSSDSKRLHPIFALPEEYTIHGRQNIVNRLRSADNPPTVSESIHLAIRLMRPTLVHIETTAIHRPGGASVRPAKELNNEAGAGFIIERMKKQYVVTNGHVIHAEENIDTPKNVNIYLSDGRVIHPVKILSDPATDIALLEIQGEYLPLEFGDSDSVQVGDFVISGGSPFGLKNSFSSGIVSAKGRRNLQVGRTSSEIQDYIQTDVAINPGNSGGPLVNLRGEAIGINAAIASASGFGEGVSFAIPVKMASSVIDQLILSGRVERGWLGAPFDQNYSTNDAIKLGVFSALFTNRQTPVYPPHSGARILTPPQSTPAGQAGLRYGDIILYYDDTVVEDKEHLTFLVRTTRPGKSVPIIFFRNGKLYDHKVVIGRMPK